MKIRSIDLNEHQVQALKEGYSRGKTPAFRKRCQLILLKNQGRTSKDVGQITGMHQNSVNNWLTRYEQNGIEGLKTRPGRGRKAILNIEQDAETIKAVVTEERQRLKQAKAILEQELDKSFSTKTLKRFLKNLGQAGNVSDVE